MAVRAAKAISIIATPVAIAFCIAVAVSMGSGCATGRLGLAYSPSGRYLVKSKTAQFYQRSPVSGHAPDAYLKLGTTVTMIRPGLYCYVDSETNGTGWVAASDLQPEPSEPYPMLDEFGSASTDVREEPEKPAIPEAYSTPFPDALRPTFSD